MATIGVLAVQGAFIEHEQMLASLGAKCVELRNAEDLKEKPDGLVLPGGESTGAAQNPHGNGHV
jgi:pyridoxal 5'-phosphate synthase pdxT subunit